MDVELAMAWVSVPDLTVSASPQRYRSGGSGAGGRARVRFDSEGFGAPVEVDAHGFVVDYPGIGHRLELGWRITLLARLRPDRSSASSRRGDRPDPRDRLAPARRRAGGEVDQRDPDRF